MWIIISEAKRCKAALALHNVADPLIVIAVQINLVFSEALGSYSPLW
jgi:hypothetical protein